MIAQREAIAALALALTGEAQTIESKARGARDVAALRRLDVSRIRPLLAQLEAGLVAIEVAERTLADEIERRAGGDAPASAAPGLAGEIDRAAGGAP